MKILHTSDWHLGMDLCQMPLLEYQKQWGEWLCQTVAEKQIDAVLVCGDVFDRAVSSAESIRLYSQIVENINRAGAQVVMIAGNHDGAARLSACAPLLEKSGVYIAGQLEYPVKTIEIEQARFFLLPYFAAERVKALFPEAENAQQATEKLMEHCRQFCTSDKKNILLAHCFATGAQPGESDRAAVVGGSAEMPLSLFDGFDYVALGHIHRPQKLKKNIVYCGTPMKYSFSEASQTKTAPMYDTETGTIEFLEIPEFVPLRVVMGDLEHLIEQAKMFENKNALMRLVRTDGIADLAAQTRLRKAFANILQIEGRNSFAENVQTLQFETKQLSELELLRLFWKEATEEPLSQELENWFLEMLEQEEEQEQ